MSNLQGSRFISSLLSKPTLAAVVEEEDSVIPRSPFSDNASKTSSNKDESIIFATSQDSRKREWLEENSFEESVQRYNEKKVQLLLNIVQQLSQLQHSIQSERGKRMRCVVLQCYNCLIGMWNIQERQWADIFELFRKVSLCNSVLLEGCSVYALFLILKSYMQTLRLPKPICWTVTSTMVCWFVLHWILSHRTGWLYPWENILMELRNKYWLNPKSGKD